VVDCCGFVMQRLEDDSGERHPVDGAMSASWRMPVAQGTACGCFHRLYANRDLMMLLGVRWFGEPDDINAAVRNMSAMEEARRQSRREPSDNYISPAMVELEGEQDIGEPDAVERINAPLGSGRKASKPFKEHPARISGRVGQGLQTGYYHGRTASASNASADSLPKHNVKRQLRFSSDLESGLL